MAIKRVSITLDVYYDTERLMVQSHGGPEPHFSADQFDYALNGEGRYQPYRVTGCHVSPAHHVPADEKPQFNGRGPFDECCPRCGSENVEITAQEQGACNRCGAEWDTGN